MKQHITIKQLNELSPELRVELNKCWRNNGQVVNLLNHEDINIGQMIEFLADNHKQYNGITYKDNDGEIYISSGYINGWKVETICNELWEAVKEVLESNV